MSNNSFRAGVEWLAGVLTLVDEGGSFLREVVETTSECNGSAQKTFVDGVAWLAGVLTLAEAGSEFLDAIVSAVTKKAITA